MAGYLDRYGEGDERRSRIFKILAASVLAVLIGGGSLFFVFHNYRQERQASQFFEMLQQKKYEGAWKLWGTTTYPLKDFLTDWGPQSGHADVGGYRISKSRSCGTGVILTVDFDKGQQEKLWVQREDLVIGFSPWPGCPANR